MLDKHGKRIPKPKAKRMLCRAIVESYARNGFKTIKKDAVENIMREYNFSRKSIYDTIVCNYHPAENAELFYNAIHNFCFSVLENQ